jgi:hypothetical protein
MRDDHVQLGSPAAAGASREAALDWHTPLHFDPKLLRQLLARHDALERELAALPDHAARDRDHAVRIAGTCAGLLHELRRQEALWIYPLMARRFGGDPVARRRLTELRFAMNGLARRVLRQIDALSQALRQAGDVRGALAGVVAALADYRLRNESELYTLYSLTDSRSTPREVSVAHP